MEIEVNQLIEEIENGKRTSEEEVLELCDKISIILQKDLPLELVQKLEKHCNHLFMLKGAILNKREQENNL